MEWIAVDKIIVSEEQREINPYQVIKIHAKLKERGYNTSYPITLDEDNILVDGGHRLEAAKLVGIDKLPFVLKPKEVSNIKHAIICNEDGTDTRAYNVFDYAEIFSKKISSGATLQDIKNEVGWSVDFISKYGLVKSKLHPLSWNLARWNSTRKMDLVESTKNTLVEFNSTKVEWRETYFRSLLSHISLNGHKDNAIMRAQLKTIRATFKQSADPKKKVTAEWIGKEAARHAWHTKLAKYMRDNLTEKVPLSERKGLLRNIWNNVFGNKEDDNNFESFALSIARINERILGVILYKDDAFQRIPLMEDKSISLVIIDPPYNVTDNDWDKIGDDNEYINWLEDWMVAIKPKLQNDYHLFMFISPHYQAKVEALLVDNNWPLQSRVIWSHRNLSNGRDIVSKFASTWEMVFHCGTHPLNWPLDWSDERFDVQEWAVPQSNFSDKKLHPTSKPIGLLELLVKVGSKPGDLVVDTFAGGGTTGAACKNIGQRQCILVETKEEYCQVIEDRLGIKIWEDK